MCKFALRRGFARLAIAAVLIALGGCAGSPRAPSASAVRPAASTVSPPLPRPFVINQPLSPGSHRSQVFATPLTFTVRDGWKVFEDEIGQFGLAEVANDAPCVCVWRDVRLMSASCADEADPATGANGLAIATALSKRPGIDSTLPAPVSVGGLRGYVLDISLDPSWTKPCPYSNGDPTVPTLVGSVISKDVAWEVGPNHRQRLYLLDLPTDGQNIAINIEVCCGAEWDERMSEVAPVIVSMSFEYQ